jgi:hypothetical protein
MSWRKPREPVALPSHDPATEMRLIEALDAITRALAVLDPALRDTRLDRHTQNVLLDVRNALVPPLPQRHPLPFAPGRSS